MTMKIYYPYVVQEISAAVQKKRLGRRLLKQRIDSLGGFDDVRSRFSVESRAPDVNHVITFNKMRKQNPQIEQGLPICSFKYFSRLFLHRVMRATQLSSGQGRSVSDRDPLSVTEFGLITAALGRGHRDQNSGFCLILHETFEYLN